MNGKEAPEPLQQAVAKSVAEDQTLTMCVTQRTLLITEEKLLNALYRHGSRLNRSEAWIAPLSVVATLVVALVGSDFRDFLLPALAWKTVVVIGLVVALGWLAVAIRNSWQSLTAEDFVAVLIAQSPARSVIPSEIVQVPSNTTEHDGNGVVPALAQPEVTNKAMQCGVCGTLLRLGLIHQVCPKCGTVN
jgi:hypothetical protein